ncbi:MAG: PAS domain S-box protein [Hydrogenophaga sp.]|nr:PAS domain S-box protein [Hydrogenophaga sp.]
MNSPPPAGYEGSALWRRLGDWHPPQHSLWLRLAVAIALTLLAAGIRIALAPAESGGRFITLSLAAALSALYGGLAAGILSTLLGMLVVNFMLIPPYGSLAFDNPVEAFWLNLWHLLTQVVVVGAIWWMQGQNQRLRGLHRELETSRKRFRDTFEFAAAGITQVDLQGRLTMVNQTFCQMVGYTPEELMQMRFQDFTHPDDIRPDEAMLQQILRGERDRYSIEKRYVRKDGQLVWAHLTVAVVRRSPDVPEYFVSVVQDISAIKTAEAALRTSERLMRQAHTLAGLASWRCSSRPVPDAGQLLPATGIALGGVLRKRPAGPHAPFGPGAHPQRLDGRRQGPSPLQLDLPRQDRWPGPLVQCACRIRTGFGRPRGTRLWRDPGRHGAQGGGATNPAAQCLA